MKFLNQLKNEEILKFFNDNKFIVLNADDLDDMREEVREENAENYYLKCLNTAENKNKSVDNFLFNAFKSFMRDYTCQYLNDNIDIISVGDFCINRFASRINERFDKRDRDLQDNYTKFMIDKFKDQNYEQELQKFIKELEKSESEPEKY